MGTTLSEESVLGQEFSWDQNSAWLKNHLGSNFILVQ
jgi:hypothetical protein